MIGSFKGRFAQEIANGRAPKGFPPDLVRVAQRKLAALIAANELQSLASRQEIASRTAEDVEIVDYH